MNNYIEPNKFQSIDLNEPKQLRNILGQFVTGVTIITTRGQDGRKIGMTANSFSSLSLDPPLILWSLSNTAPSLSDFMATKQFVIHMLGQEHHGLSGHFSRGVTDKFSNVAHTETAEGTPLIEHALVTLICENYQQVEGGDHTIFIGKINKYHKRDGEPLVCHAGQYRSITIHPEL